MLQEESQVVIADNTGAKIGKIIRIKKGSNARFAGIGDIVVLAVQSSSPKSSIKEGEVVTGIVVRTKKEIARKDGTYVRFDDNAVVIMDIDAKGELKLKWKRIFWPVARELRDIDRAITNMAEETV